MVPCGRCAWCRKKKRDEWCVRFLAESLKTPCYFLTLTYEDSFIPTRFVSASTGETFVFRGWHDDYLDDDILRIGSVPYLKDCQDYLKRVRKALSTISEKSSENLKFFLVSEYGKLRGRVHYHLCVWSDCDEIKDILVKQWPFGDAVADPAGLGSQKYVTKYILKGSDKKSNDLRDDNLKTNSAGIGSDLWPKLVRHYTSEGFTNTFQWFGSYRAFPAYYKKKIREYLDNQSDCVAIKIVANSKGELVVKNLHCDLVRKLDDLRQIPSINDDDLVHSLLRLKVSDLPEYVQRLYRKDYEKQFEINSKTSLLFNQ